MATVVPFDDQYIDPNANYTPSGWSKVFGFFDGVTGVADRVTGLTENYRDIATNVTDGRRSIWDLKRDKEEFDQDQLLEKATTLRGDNKTQLYVIGAVALAAVVLLTTQR